MEKNKKLLAHKIFKVAYKKEICSKGHWLCGLHDIHLSRTWRYMRQSLLKTKRKEGSERIFFV